MRKLQSLMQSVHAQLALLQVVTAPSSRCTSPHRLRPWLWLSCLFTVPLWPAGHRCWPSGPRRLAAAEHEEENQVRPAHAACACCQGRAWEGPTRFLTPWQRACRLGSRRSRGSRLARGVSLAGATESQSANVEQSPPSTSPGEDDVYEGSARTRGGRLLPSKERRWHGLVRCPPEWDDYDSDGEDWEEEENNANSSSDGAAPLRAVALFDFFGKEADHLTFRSGDLVRITDRYAAHRSQLGRGRGCIVALFRLAWGCRVR